MTDDAPAPSGASLGTAIVFSTHMDGLAAFYRAALDLGEPETVQARHRGWRVGPAYFGIDQVDAVAGAAPGGVSLWFTVDDLEATFARCVELGATVKSGPRSPPWGGRLAAVFDPDGNLLGLTQRRDS